MNPKFAIKKISCSDYAEVLPKIGEAELNWLQSLLCKIKVPQIMIDKALNDAEYSKTAWRHYLFDTHGIIIVKNLASQRVVVTKINSNTGEKLVLGEWLKPEIVRIQGIDKIDYEINLKCWQIV